MSRRLRDRVLPHGEFATVPRLPAPGHCGVGVGKHQLSSSI